MLLNFLPTPTGQAGTGRRQDILLITLYNLPARKSSIKDKISYRKIRLYFLSSKIRLKIQFNYIKIQN